MKRKQVVVWMLTINTLRSNGCLIIYAIPKELNLIYFGCLKHQQINEKNKKFNVHFAITIT